MWKQAYKDAKGVREMNITDKGLEEIEKMADRHWANTQVKQALIDGLKLREVSNGKAAAIYCMIETDEKRMDMIQYILENKKGTEDEFLNEARRIAAK